MARRPKPRAVATATHGERPRRDSVCLLLRGAVALGGGAMDVLLLGPLRRLIWRWLYSRSARRGSVAARMARRAWWDDAEPAGHPVLRRAVALAGGAIQGMLVPGRRVLAVVRSLLQRVLRLVPDFVLRLLRPPRLCQGQRPETQPEKKKNAGARMYKDDPLRRRAPPPPTPPPSPPRREPIIVDGVVVPEGVVDQYANYCKAARECPANSTLCHLCSFEMQRSQDCTVRTSDVFIHCSRLHDKTSPTVRCDVVDCSVRVRPGRELALHMHFCHRLAPDWWNKYP